MSERLYKLVKKRGFKEVISTLSTFENCQTSQTEFLTRFQKEKGFYYNLYLRIRADLLKTGLIDFKVNEQNEKVILLTEKGKKVWEKMQTIENL